MDLYIDNKAAKVPAGGQPLRGGSEELNMADAGPGAGQGREDGHQLGEGHPLGAGRQERVALRNEAAEQGQRHFLRHRVVLLHDVPRQKLEQLTIFFQDGALVRFRRSAAPY